MQVDLRAIEAMATEYGDSVYTLIFGVKRDCMAFLKPIACLFLTSLTAITSGCASMNADADDHDENTDLSYRYNYNECDTGKQSFDSKKNLCTALLDEDVNGNCAQQLRHAAYKRDCEQFGTLEERVGTSTAADPEHDLAVATPCGEKLCKPSEFCFESKRRDNDFDLVPPRCLARSSEIFDCDDAEALAKKEFPTSNNCSGWIECLVENGQFTLTCYLPGS